MLTGLHLNRRSSSVGERAEESGGDEIRLRVRVRIYRELRRGSLRPHTLVA
jgi:hypothetical protein